MMSKLLPLTLALFFSCSSPQMTESKTDLTSQVTSFGQADVTSFKTLKLLFGKMEVNVPEQLQPMDKKMFELKYPSENQNITIAYSDSDVTVSLLISPRQDKATRADLPKYQQMLNNRFADNLSIDFRRSKIRQINGRDFIVIEIITPAIDTKVYNLMFVTYLGGKLLMGSFNCTVEKMQAWQPFAEQILGSVKVKD